MNRKVWGRRLDRLGVIATPARNDQRQITIELIAQQLTPVERETATDLRERLNAVGLEGLTDVELDRLETLIEKLENEPKRDMTE
jgi:hypothetical protein